MKRSKETARIIANVLGFGDNIIYLNQLAEVKKGTLSGLTNDDPLMKELNEIANNEIKRMTDPIIKYELNDPQKENEFYEKICTRLGIQDVELYKELIERVDYTIEYLRCCQYRKIIVVSHSGLLEILLKRMFNLNVLPRGDFPNGKNCSISYCTYSKGKFKMVSPMNTEHLSII